MNAVSVVRRELRQAESELRRHKATCLPCHRASISGKNGCPIGRALRAHMMSLASQDKSNGPRETYVQGTLW